MSIRKQPNILKSIPHFGNELCKLLFIKNK